MLEKKYGKAEAAKRIYATTDKARGALKNLATEEGYEPLFPGIMASQHKYVEEVIASLSGTADLSSRESPPAEAIEALTAQYTPRDWTGILILMLSYSQGQYLVHAMQRNTLPLALALVQPDETVGDDFEEWELTVNQASTAHRTTPTA